MVVYYINKTSDRLADCSFPVEEGDICLLYDGEMVKTVYIDSETDGDAIWRDYKFIDSKSLKSYSFPKKDSILCAPLGEGRAVGDAGLLTQLTRECKSEWLLDFLNETSALLSGFADYWDLEILRRLTGNEEIGIAYGDEATLSTLVGQPEEEGDEDDDDEVDMADDADFLPKSYDIRWFCLTALACLEGLMDECNYQILSETLKGTARREIASRFGLTQERIRQIVVKSTKQARELLKEQRRELEDAKADNAQLNVQIGLLKEEIGRLQSLLPDDVLTGEESCGEGGFEAELAKMLETTVNGLNITVRAKNVLHAMEIRTFAEIPQIKSAMALLRVRNSGRKTVHDISQMLDDFRLTFGMSLAKIVDILSTNEWQAAKRKWVKALNRKENADMRLEEPVESAVQTPTESLGTEEAKRDEATVVLTKEIIDAARTPNGGFTKSQLAALGIGWPAPEDLIEKKVGTMITPTQLENFNRIEYVAKPSGASYRSTGTMTYKDVAFNSDDRRRMEAILQAMTHFYKPATPHDIARAVSRTAWGDEMIREETVDSILKRLPEVEYVEWGRYIIKSRNK